MKTANIIDVQNVCYSYGNDNVLDNITLIVQKGDYLGIVGPNGAGKTTLLKIILGLLVPSKGSVLLFEKDIRQFKDWKKIGYVPQTATNFDKNFPATVYDAVMMGRFGYQKLFQKTSAEDKHATKIALEQVNMWDFRNRRIGDLSTGQQQRVFIARALVTSPEVIILDEPTVGIDQKTHDAFYALLKKLNNELRLTVVLISHDVEVVVGQVKHIAYIDRDLVYYSSPEEFMQGAESQKLLGKGVNILAHEHKH